MYKISVKSEGIIHYLNDYLKQFKTIYIESDQKYYDIISFKLVNDSAIGNLIDDGGWTEEEYLKCGEEDAYVYLKNNIEIGYRKDESIKKLL